MLRPSDIVVDFRSRERTTTFENVVYATASPQWLAGRPSHPVRGGPSARHPLRTRLGPDVYENGRGSVQHRRKGSWSVTGIGSTGIVKNTFNSTHKRNCKHTVERLFKKKDLFHSRKKYV